MRDSSMQVGVDVNRCVASGMCALLAPGVFDQEEDTGQVVLLEERPPAEEWEAVEEAQRSCPGQVIRFREAAATRGEGR
ncbi:MULTISPECIES: ferredoxin [unclassified Streptomyces]|uniref:ferredoxin n=1 Tax=unclassified Streptomyces TaxID=2593676 RepID=UPI0022553C3E|nr:MULTISPECIES: ferredoxin [unclassified Streptomyces]MCX5330379.1 ferredoxin [Streptomyces sp. NBC_00140]MCX5359776.1 ferredoxin [Streptomyces sp. NBC_00124]